MGVWERGENSAAMRPGSQGRAGGSKGQQPQGPSFVG